MKKSIKLLTTTSALIAISLIFGFSYIKNTDTLVMSTYFNKGVYKADSPDNKNPYKNYFYVFYNKTSGHTEDKKHGIGLPFSCMQKKGYVKFKFGGIDEPEKTFKIKHAKNDTITGYFEDGSLLIFTPVLNVNPDNFDAVEYIKRK